MGILSSARILTLKSLRGTGVSHAIGSSPWRRRRLLILAYHGISLRDEHEWDPTLFVSPAFLERRLELLRRRGCAVLDLGEAVERLARGDLPPRAVVLTFDDGLYDFLAAGVPLLRAYQMPATLYSSTYHTLDQRAVFNVAGRYALWRSAAPRLDLSEILGTGSVFERTRFGAAWQAILADCERREASAAGKDAVLERLCAALDVDLAAIRSERLFTLLTLEELAEVAGAGFDVQLHTHRHRSPLEREALHREIEDNRALLAGVTSRPLTHFCYPSGRYGLEQLPWLRELGIASATTCRPDLVPPGCEPLLLPRFIDTMMISDEVFCAWLDGTMSLLPRRRRWAS